MKKVFFQNWILLFYLFAFMVLAVLIQGFWALWDYHSARVCNWLDCDILIDLFLMSLPPISFTFILTISFFTITSDRIVSTAVAIFVLLVSCLIIDTEIFVNRETSWGTYENIWHQGFCLAARPILITGLIFVLPFYALSKRIIFCTKC